MQLEELQKIWSDNSYYPMAEEYMHAQWERIIWPKIKDCDFSYTIDLACGHGRNTQKLVNHARNLILVDICQQNLDVCRARFLFLPKIEYLLCDGKSIPISDNIATLIYCWDAMVHFDAESINGYLEETYRVLQPGGIGFFHHSNFCGISHVNWRHNPHARNEMPQGLFIEMATKAGLKIISSDIINWGDCIGLDCITMVKK